MKSLFSIFITVLSFFLASQALAQSSITCATLTDVYIDQYDPNKNFNDKTRVLISEHLTKGIARGLWKFDIPTTVDQSHIQSALLHLSGSWHTGTTSPSIDICCYALNSPFGEGSATWTLLAGGNYDNTTCSAGNLPAGNDWEATIDVTTLLQQELDKVRSYGMLMKKQDEAVAGYQSIASREATDPADFAAYIVISDTPVTTTISTTTTAVSASTTTTTTKRGAILCSAVADIAIDEWKPDENLNYYERVVLATNHNIHHGISRGLFLFDIPLDLEQTDVRRAEICLSACHHCGGGDGGEVGFYALNEPFHESTDTWNSLQGGSWDNDTVSKAELPGGADWNTAVNGEPPQRVKCMDVTELMKDKLEKTRNNGIMMRFMDEAQDPPVWQSVASHETTDPLDFAPYMVIHTKRCPAKMVFENDTETLDLLRSFRDKVLSTTPEGRRWTAFYYRYAELISDLLEKSPALRRQSRAALEGLLPNIGLLVDDKDVDHRAMRRHARQLIDLFKKESAVELKTSLSHMLK